MPAPFAINNRATSMSPLRAANMSGVKPLAVEVWTLAPPSMSVVMISEWPIASAHMSAVAFVSSVVALTFARLAISALTTFALPVRDAIISGVRPLFCVAFGSAPASSSRPTIASLAFSDARASAVTP